MDTLRAATINAAKSIHLDDTGLIKEGYIADLVILNKNPLKNISNTQDINTIVKGGKVYSQEDVLSHVPSEEDVDKKMGEFMMEWESAEVMQ